MRQKKINYTNKLSKYFDSNYSGIFRGSFCDGGKITPCVKLVRIMLET